MIVLAAAVLLGLLIGSFLNVVIWRVPRGESVVSPPSACPRCGHAIRRRDNVPLLSWVVLRGRCRDCGAGIPARYPAVEAGTAVAFGAVATWSPEVWLVPALLYLAAITITLTLIDLDLRRLPDRIVLPSYPVSIVLLVLAAWSPAGVADWDALRRALLGGLALFAAYGLLWLIYPKGMGLGDVKLAGVLGLYLGYLGWGPLVVGWFAAFVLGGLFSIILLAMRRVGRGSGIPFGPWMLLGCWVGMVAGPAVSSWYIGVLGL